MNAYIKIFLNHVIWGALVGICVGFVVSLFNIVLALGRITFEDIGYSFLLVPVSTLTGILIGLYDITMIRFLALFNKQINKSSILWAIIGTVCGCIVFFVMLFFMPEEHEESDIIFLMSLPVLICCAITGCLIGVQRNINILK